MKKIKIIILLALLYCSNLFPQQQDTITIVGTFSFCIDSIKISGNKITDEDIIYRELTFKVNDTVNQAILKFNEDRIYSLGIFTTVNLIPYLYKEKVILEIEVRESWYIWPIPFAHLKDRSWDKITYGFDINVKNFRGRNEALRTRFAFGYDPSISIMYYNPLFISSQSISLQLDAANGKMNNISYRAKRLYGDDFTQKYSGASFTLGKRMKLFHYFFFNGSFQYIETPKYIKGISASNERIDRLYSLGMGYTYDSRNLIQSPDNGIYFNTSYQFKGMGINDIDYKILNFDFREYRPLIGNLSAKWRFYMRQTYGYNVPYFDYSYLGHAERIRGYYNISAEGNSAYLASAEIKYPIVKEWDIEFDFPLIPKSLQTYRLSIYTQAFYDAGAVKDREEELRIKNFLSGYGFGLTLLVLPYNIARIEMGFNEQGKYEWIFDIGISF